MADSKISALTTLAQADLDAAADFVPVVDTGATTTKKITPDDLVAGAIEQGAGLATQAQQEAGSATTVFVSPGRQHFHPSAVKVHAQFGVAGNIRGTSYNVSSITDSGTGLAVVNYSITLSESQHPAVCTAYCSSATNFYANINGSVGQSTTSTAVVCVNGSSAANVDPSVGYNFMACGDI